MKIFGVRSRQDPERALANSATLKPESTSRMSSNPNTVATTRTQT